MANPAYVGRIGTPVVDTAPTGTDVITVGSAGVPAGATIMISFCQGSYGSAGGVSVADSKGNSYVQGPNADDTAHDATTVFYAVNITHALVSGDTITVTFPTGGSEAFFAADEFSGVTSVDVHVFGVNGSSGNTSFSSGASPTTTAADELLWVAAGLMTTSGAETWGSGWNTSLADLNNSGDVMSTVYQTVTATGSYTAAGTLAAGLNGWMVILVTFKGSTAPTFLAPPPYVANQAPQRAATW